MKQIAPAETNAWAVRVRPSEAGGLLVETSGKATFDGDRVRLRHGCAEPVVATVSRQGVDVHTLHRNQAPVYRRLRRGEVWLSNDVALLCEQGETLRLRSVELLLAVSGWTGIRSPFSHLIEGIELLLPASRYRIARDGAALTCHWADIEFSPAEEMDRATLLASIQDKYARLLEDNDEVCLALSGGYDSRFLLALLVSLGKRVHCAHYRTHIREARITRQLARTAGATQLHMDAGAAQTQGWQFLNAAGYVTRWDGFFAPGALAAAGLYTSLQQSHPHAVKIILDTGPLKGRLYAETGDPAAAYWLRSIDDDFAPALAAFPEHRDELAEEARVREARARAVLDRIGARFARVDVRTDAAYGLLHPLVGKLTTRTAFLVENGMPLLGGDRRIREMFAGLPVPEKQGHAFLEHGIAQLAPALLDHGFASSSMLRAEAHFGSLARNRAVAPVLQRVPVRLLSYGKQRSDHNWLAEVDPDSPLYGLPAVRAHLRERPPTGTRSVVLAMIANFIATMRARGIGLTNG